MSTHLKANNEVAKTGLAQVNQAISLVAYYLAVAVGSYETAFKEVVGLMELGAAAIGCAIAYYSTQGLVSVTINRMTGYQLVVDSPGRGLQRVNVRSCRKKVHGFYQMTIALGYKRTDGTVREYDNTRFERVFVLTEVGDIYDIPSEVITAKQKTSLNIYEKYKIRPLDEMVDIGALKAPGQ